MSKVTKEQKSEIQTLAEMPEGDINTKDIPEVDFTDGKVEIGKFYRPLKKSVTIRLDADVIAWFKEHSTKYQTEVNQALREYMLTHN